VNIKAPEKMNSLYAWICLAIVFTLFVIAWNTVCIGNNTVGDSLPKLVKDSPTAGTNTIGTSSAVPAVAIFYNAFVPSTEGQQGIDHAFGIIWRQLHQVADSYAASSQSKPVTVYYNSIGSKMLNKTSTAGLCSNDNNNIIIIVCRCKVRRQGRTANYV
jgi:hypothetical protein